MGRKHGSGRRWARWWLFGLVLMGLLFSPPSSGAYARDGHPQEEPDAESQVAQLFLVAWDGSPLEDEAPLVALLQRWPVAGVMLVPGPERPYLEWETVAQGVRQLQALAAEHARARRQGFPRPEQSRPFFPMLIGVEQVGNGPPYDTLGFATPLPSPLAIGATWNPELAYQVGRIMGRQMRAWGVNLLFGPPLDLLDPTFIGQPGDLGVQVFGEHPFWVTQMAQRYVQGLHEGAGNRLAVVGRTFPGYGGAAHPLEEEIPTVPLPKEQIESTWLVPFLTIARQAEASGQGVDAFLVGHIRYQAFQGTIRADTPPLSLDPEALQKLRQTYPDLEAWYQAADRGRVFISMDLGAPALKRYFQAQEAQYDPVQVALSAFLAGNDLLYLGPGFHTEKQDYWATVEATLQAFAQKYREDPVFRQRVDASVERIRNLRLRLGTALVSVLPADQPPSFSPEEEEILLRVAREGATLLASTEEGAQPRVPSTRENILILVDPAPWQACPQCPAMNTFPIHDFRQTLLRLYGPQGRGQILPGRVQTFTADQVQAWLENPEDEALAGLHRALQTAPWVVFLVADAQSPGAQTLLQMLEQYPELWRERQVVVFSFHVPYMLQPTHLAHVTTYYSLYSKGGAFLDIAARLLFRELPPTGASPVSVPALGYSISTVVLPNPEQEIPLTWMPPGRDTPLEAKQQRILQGTTLAVQAGPILDHNGHPVPDGTSVEFILSEAGRDTVLQRTEAFTRQGLARASFTFDRPGIFQVRARCGQAEKSQILMVEVDK